MTVTEVGAVAMLSPREALVLRVLDDSRNRVVSRQALLDAVWGQGYAGDPSTLAVHVTRLRAKLAASGIGWGIRTVRGVGYILEDAEPA